MDDKPDAVPDQLLVMGPHAKHLNSTFVFEYLIHETVLNIDTARTCAPEISEGTVRDLFLSPTGSLSKKQGHCCNDDRRPVLNRARRATATATTRVRGWIIEAPVSLALVNGTVSLIDA